MTHAEAIKEAESRWNRRRRQGTMRGSLDRQGRARYTAIRQGGVYEVGYDWNKCHTSWKSRKSWSRGLEVMGRGKTWKAAFADADRRVAEAKESRRTA